MLRVVRDRSGRGVSIALLSCFLGACRSGAPPDLVRVELPELVTSPDPVRVSVSVRRGGSSAPANEPVSYSVAPPELAAVAKDGTLTCLKSGDAKVTADVLGVKGTASLHCRLVDRLELGELPALDVNAGPQTLSVRALAKGGAELNEVPVSITTQNPRVLKASARTLTPLAVGETSFTVRAGTKQQTVPVRIVRTLDPEALPLDGGRRVHFSLPEGKYEVEVTFPSDKQLQVEWRGAPYCAYKATARKHQARCTLQGKGGAVIDNPAFVLNGSTEISKAGVVVREIP
jgi:hypothetical protein